MNIKDFWPEYEGKRMTSSAVWLELLQLRKKTFLGFLEIEKEKGFLKPSPIHLSQTQDMVRILLFRTLEEFGEAIQSKDDEHHKEELIDGLNFLYSIYFLDESLMDIDDFSRRLSNYVEVHTCWFDLAFSVNDLGKITLRFSDLGDYLRNRSWMNQPQDLYFNGSFKLFETFFEVTRIVLQSFESFDEFYHYYVAKDSVLQFRIQSKY